MHHCCMTGNTRLVSFRLSKTFAQSRVVLSAEYLPCTPVQVHLCLPEPVLSLDCVQCSEDGLRHKEGYLANEISIQGLQEGLPSYTIIHRMQHELPCAARSAWRP